MINVNSKYKKAIKESTRELSSFVELLVDGEYINAHENYGNARITVDDKAEITDLDTVVDEEPLYIKYASLEDNYTLLDGSFILPNRNFTNKYTGYIGKKFYDTINITNLNLTKRCISIYFDMDSEFDIEITLYTEYSGGSKIFTFNYSDYNKDVLTTDKIPEVLTVNGVNDTFEYIASIKIEINNNYSSSHRIRVKQINAGETILYDDKEIIEVKVNEQTDLYNIEIPNNNCSIKLNNYDRKFNVVDENNILNKLNKNSIIRPYYGINIDGCYEYISMGNYEFTSYEDRNNYDTTILGKGYIENLDEEFPYINDLADEYTVEYISDRILDKDNTQIISNIKYNQVVPLIYTNFQNKREQIQALGFISESYIKQTRIKNYNNYKNIVKLDTISSDVVDTINLNREIEYPKFIKKNKMNKFTIHNSKIGDLEENESTLFEDIIVPETIDGTYYNYSLKINSSQPIDLSTIKVYRNNVESTSYYINQKSYYNFIIELYGFGNNNEVSLKITAKQFKENDEELNLDYSNSNNGTLIEINNNYLRNKYDKERICKYIMNIEKDYEFEVEILGDPSLEIGDTILLENIDGYKLGTITSIETTYNGGLTSILKGECSNVL